MPSIKLLRDESSRESTTVKSHIKSEGIMNPHPSPRTFYANTKIFSKPPLRKPSCGIGKLDKKVFEDD